LKILHNNCYASFISLTKSGIKMNFLFRKKRQRPGVSALVAFLALSLPGTVWAQSADSSTAIAGIDAVMKSLQAEPNQFSIEVICSGLSVNMSGGGGTGVSVSVSGGGSGPTTGMVVNAGSGQCNVQQGTAIADNAVGQQSVQAVKLLADIKAQLQAPKPNQKNILSKLSEFSNAYVAPVVQAVVQALVLKALHL
jgi:hypothetical protein